MKLAPVVHAPVGRGQSMRVVFTAQHTDPRLALDEPDFTAGLPALLAR